MALACQRLKRFNVDITIVTELKVNGFCPTQAEGYQIVATQAASAHKGGVSLVFRRTDAWHVEDAKEVGPNLIRTTVVHGRNCTTIFGIYIPPSEEDCKIIQHFTQEMERADETYTIVLGDLNIW